MPAARGHTYIHPPDLAAGLTCLALKGLQAAAPSSQPPPTKLCVPSLPSFLPSDPIPGGVAITALNFGPLITGLYSCGLLLGTIYSVPPLRLKRSAVAAFLIIAAVGGMEVGWRWVGWEGRWGGWRGGLAASPAGHTPSTTVRTPAPAPCLLPLAGPRLPAELWVQSTPSTSVPLPLPPAPAPHRSAASC